MSNIIGIDCSISDSAIQEVLHFLSCKSFDFFVYECMMVTKNVLLPQTTWNFSISPENLKELSKETLWEFVLHIYPINAKRENIETFDNYMQSQCVCCLIYYDCGFLEVYSKDAALRQELYELLVSLKATELEFITDDSVHRTLLYP